MCPRLKKNADCEIMDGDRDDRNIPVCRCDIGLPVCLQARENPSGRTGDMVQFVNSTKMRITREGVVGLE